MTEPFTVGVWSTTYAAVPPSVTPRALAKPDPAGSVLTVVAVTVEPPTVPLARASRVPVPAREEPRWMA
ncbi:hypothetical protein ABTZ03_28315 [Kitasatospora sp. NPDC096077]|uniref:hypothetical protein n=1 Tax=Kitasatospora sp. NPDC096077 TaxID=3155544 RepID=UPI00332D0A0E